MTSAEDIRRKLKALAAILRDRGATDGERQSAAALRRRLERRLEAAGVPKGDWTDAAFRLGRALQQMAKNTAPRSPKGDWTDHAARLGKALRRSYKRMSSD